MRVIVGETQISDHMIQCAHRDMCAAHIALRTKPNRPSRMNKVPVVLCASRFDDSRGFEALERLRCTYIVGQIPFFERPLRPYAVSRNFS